MAEGVIIAVKKGYSGTIRGDDGNEYRFNRKRIIKGDFRQIQMGLRVEFEPDGEWASQLRLLDEVQELPQQAIVSPSISGQRQKQVASKKRPQPKPSSTDGYRFLNPYNFVRLLGQPRPENHILGNCSPPPHDRYLGLTGHITGELKAVTPLFISDSHTVSEDANGHKTYRFFQMGGQPALPASSLRGMVRSVFEAVTNSCFVAFDQDPLSFHLASTRAPWLVPARVERDGDNWHLRLLTGTTKLQIESPGKNPEGFQYAAWSASYWPIKPSKTLRGIGPKGRKLSQKQLASRQSFINRTQSQVPNPDGIGHGEECYALLEPFQHPHPRIKFWNVLEIRRDRSDLPQPQGKQRVEYGWLCITNQNIEPKHSERFFFRAKDNRTGPEYIDLPEDVRHAYEALVKDYQERHRDAVQKRRRKGQSPERPVGDEPAFSRFVYQNDERKLKGGELIYAMLEGTINAPRVKFIVPVAVPRVTYEHSRGELLPGYFQRCKDYNQLCPACRVFGWVRESAEDIGQDVPTAYAGRVRFSHGTLIYSAGELPETTLAILSTPKPTTTPFYLLNSNGRPDTTVTYDSHDAQLRGRKFYRHHRQADPDEYQRNERSDQNRTVCGALQPGATFTFTLNFENLHPLELGALLYALELEGGMYHRLGYAKPLGFGSVKITVDEVKVLDWEQRLQSLEANAGWRTLAPENQQNYRNQFLQQMQALYGTDFEQIVLADLRALLKDPPELPIHYPRPTRQFDPDHPQFEWFVGNKRRIEKRQNDAVSLPLADEDGYGLPLIKKDGGEG